MSRIQTGGKVMAGIPIPAKTINYSLDENPTFSRSSVDIIIPFHGQYHRVAKLVESILRITRSNPYQICLVDDASPNIDFISHFESSKHERGYYANQIFPVRSNERLGFGGALKLGFENTQQPWVCFLNSDCLIEEAGWLIEMGKSLLALKKQGVRMVSAISNNPGQDCDHRLEARKGEYLAADVVLENDATPLPLYCVMCHRELFDNIGGFIKDYPYGMYEDEELAFRMKKCGFKQGICAKSWVYHKGGCTINEEICFNPDAKIIMEENRDRCIRDMKRI